MSDDDDLIDTPRYEWERLVRRVRMGSSTKLVALTVSTYASRDGSSIYPGGARLSAVTELSDKTVRVGLAWLRDAGLLKRTRKGSHLGRQALADEYRLTRPVDILTRLEMLDPDETPVVVTGDRAEKAPDHRYSVPGSPVTDAGSPVTDDRITGNGYRPPNHDHSTYQPTYQRENPVRDVTTESGDELLAKLIEVDEEYAARRGA